MSFINALNDKISRGFFRQETDDLFHSIICNPYTIYKKMHTLYMFLLIDTVMWVRDEYTYTSFFILFQK